MYRYSTGDGRSVPASSAPRQHQHQQQQSSWLPIWLKIALPLLIILLVYLILSNMEPAYAPPAIDGDTM